MSSMTTDARRFYLAVIEFLPDACEPTLRSLATRFRRMRRGVRIARRTVRRSVRRLIRKISQRIRKISRRISRSARTILRRNSIWVRSAARIWGRSRFRIWMRSRFRELWIRSAVLRTLVVPLRSVGLSAPIRRALTWAHTHIPLLATVLSPTMRVPGRGPLVLVDCRGTANAPTWEMLNEAEVGVNWRALVVVDDPDLGVLRDAGLVYEYLPSVPPAYCGSALTSELITHQRMRLFRSAYRPAQITTPSDLAATLTNLNVPMDHATGAQPAL